MCQLSEPIWSPNRNWIAKSNQTTNHIRLASQIGLDRQIVSDHRIRLASQIVSDCRIGLDHRIRLASQIIADFRIVLDHRIGLASQIGVDGWIRLDCWIISNCRIGSDRRIGSDLKDFSKPFWTNYGRTFALQTTTYIPMEGIRILVDIPVEYIF